MSKPKLETFPKIDAHFHANHFKKDYLRIAEKYNTRYITINTDAAVFPAVKEQEKVARGLQEQYPGLFSYVCSFAMKGWMESHWYRQVLSGIDESLQAGAVGVKIWKNIGMQLRKPNGDFLLVNDPFFAPLFEYLQSLAVPVLAHLGEPRNCWMPLDRMTTARNRAYYEKHPEFHAYLHPAIPGYDQQISARDNLLEQYPRLLLIGAHLGSLEWSIDELARRFDRYANFYVDCSSRIGHLQLQSVTRYEEVRAFMIRYANRILYGTDAYDDTGKLENALVSDWHFLATEAVCTSPEVERSFRGIALPESVLEQLYFGNAVRLYRRLSPDWTPQMS